MRAAQISHAIIERADAAAALIGSLDLGDPEIRTSVVEAVDALYARFVDPVADHLATDVDAATLYFDLEAAAGRSLSGLALGLLAQELPGLTAPPDDARLAAIDAEYGIGDTADQRRAFFAVWTADRAIRAARKLLDALGRAPSRSPGPIPSLATAVASAAATEQDRLRALLEHPLPTLERELILGHLARASDRR